MAPHLHELSTLPQPDVSEEHVQQAIVDTPTEQKPAEIRRSSPTTPSSEVREIRINTNDPETAILCNPMRRRLIEEDMDPQIATELALGARSPREVQKAITLHRIKRRKSAKASPLVHDGTKQKEPSLVFAEQRRDNVASDPDRQTFHVQRFSRRKLLQAIGGFGLASIGGGIIESLAKPFSKDLLTSMSAFSQPRIDKDGVMHLPADARKLTTPVNTIDHQGWSNEMRLQEPLMYSEQFPDHELSWTFETDDGKEVGRVTIKDKTVKTKGSVKNDRMENGEKSLQINTFPTEEESVLVMKFQEESEALGILEEQEITIPMRAYTYNSENTNDQPCVFSEIDVDTLYPDKQILHRAHELVTRFQNVLPDVTVTLFDASDTQYLGTRPDYFYNETQRIIMLPIQYWINPAYEHQDTLTLFRMLSYATVISSTHNISLQTVETGLLEALINATKDENLQRENECRENFKSAMGNNTVFTAFSNFCTYEEMYIGLEPKHYNQHLASEPVFSAHEIVPQFRRLVTDGMTILANFSSDFTLQFFIDDPSHPLYLSPIQQRRTLAATQQLFHVLDTMSPHQSYWRTIIPDYDRLRAFVFTHQPRQV